MMQMRIAKGILLTLMMFLGSPEVAWSDPLSPVQSEDRVVSPTPPGHQVLVLGESMVWLDQALYDPTRGIRFTAGTYTLEAEDADYRYYRAPSPIEYRVFANGKVKDGRFMPGGIYLSKALISLVPAGGYLSVDDTNKTLVWKLGADFMHSEGQKWHLEEK
jgi:hypothetical protein